MGMILEQLEIPRPQTAADLRRNLKRSFRKNRRSVISTLKSQYYLTSALRDARRAVSLNEDITIGVLIVIAVLSFATICVLADALFIFMQVANVLSSVLHINLAFLAAVAIAVVSTLLGWSTALQQNLLSITLIEGINRKQKRSLRLTMRNSLRKATTVFTAWLVLLSLAVVPGGAVFLTTALIILLTHTALTEAVIYLVVSGAAAIFWLAYVGMNYGLAPYVASLEKHPDWLTIFQRSRQLVSRRGRLFILGTFAAMLLSLSILYLLAMLLSKTFDMNVTSTFLTLGILPLTLANACLTMLYRKRKLARV
jgi:hypothetical protein